MVSLLIILYSAYITSVFETEPRKTKKLDTFVDALTYLLTAGEFERAADFLAVYEDTLSHFCKSFPFSGIPYLQLLLQQIYLF